MGLLFVCFLPALFDLQTRNQRGHSGHKANFNSTIHYHFEPTFVLFENLIWYLGGITRGKTFVIYFFSFIIQHTARTDAQVCLKNYNSDANNKEVFTVDYMITGGRQRCHKCTGKKIAEYFEL